MRRRQFLGAALAAAGGPSRAAQSSRRQPRPPDVEVLRIASVRQQGVIAYDGAFKITGERPVVGLFLVFEFFATTKDLLSIQRIQVEPATLQPGEQRDFEFQGRDVPRAVSYKLAARDAAGRDLRLSGEGPYPLD